MVEPLRFYNEKDELLLELENRHGGSVKYPQKGFNCSKCFKHYFTPYACRRHSEKCVIPLTNGIYEKNNLSIVKIDNQQNKKLVNAICELAYFSKREQGVDWVLINRYEGLNKNQPVYALFKQEKLIGYVAYWKQKLIDNNKPFYPWIMWDVYIIKPERRKGYASLICDTSLADLSDTYENVFYSIPLTKDAVHLLKSKGLKKINAKHGGGWTQDIPL